MTTPVCLSFGVFPSSTPRDTPFLTNALLRSINFYILGRISSSPAAFPDFNPCKAAGTYVNVKTSSFPTSIESHVSVVFAYQGSNKSSKYFLHRKKISFSSLRLFPVESLI